MLRSTVAILLLAAGPALADDWPQWMGPTRDDRLEGDRHPPEVPPGGPKKLWTRPVGGGYAGPAVANGKVYVTDYLASGDDRQQPHRPRRSARARSASCAWTPRPARSSGSTSTTARTTSATRPAPAAPRPSPTARCTPSGPWATCTSSTPTRARSSGARTSRRTTAPRPRCGVSPATRSSTRTRSSAWSAGTACWWRSTRTPARRCGSRSPPPARDGRVQPADAHRGRRDEATPHLAPGEAGERQPGRRQAVLGRAAQAGLRDVDHGARQESGTGCSPAGSGGPGWCSSSTRTSRPPRRSGGASRTRPTGSTRSTRPRTSRTGSSTGSISPAACARSSWTPASGCGRLRSRCSARRRTRRTGTPTGRGRPSWSRTATGTSCSASPGIWSIAKLSPKGYEEIDRAKLLDPTNEAFKRPVVWSHPAFADKCVFARNDKEIVCYSLAE